MMKLGFLNHRSKLLFPLLIAFSLSLYFYYLDEAKYNLDGILEFTNLLLLGIYTLILFGFLKLIQMGINSFELMRNKSVLIQNIVSAIILVALLAIFFIIIS